MARELASSYFLLRSTFYTIKRMAKEKLTINNTHNYGYIWNALHNKVRPCVKVWNNAVVNRIHAKPRIRNRVYFVTIMMMRGYSWKISGISLTKYRFELDHKLKMHIGFEPACNGCKNDFLPIYAKKLAMIM